MNILVIGSGGREHAISYKLAASPHCKQLFIAPGNAGTQAHGRNVQLDPLDFSAMDEFIQTHEVKLVVIGPEAPLAAGLADFLREKGIPTVGPGKAGSILECSKDWSKQFMERYGIPTAAYRSFHQNQVEEAVAYVQNHALPVVVKASGLAAGKGVLICEDHASAVEGLREMLSGNAFGGAGSTVVIEEFLTGIEVSVFVLTDGKSYKILPEAKDYKRIGEGDTGLNTGGMGAVSPVSIADQTFMDKVEQQVIQPTLKGLAAENIPYQGFIFLGLIKVSGEPFVIEYNVRMGDPETEVVFPRIQSDVVELLQAAAVGQLAEVDLKIDPRACCTVMLVSGGYPGNYEKGKVITGVDQVKEGLVFHAGTRLSEGELLTNGGRVLALSSFAEDLSGALKLSMKNAALINFEGKYFRKDIGKDLLGLKH